MTRTFGNVRSLSDYFCFWAAIILVTSVSQHLSQPLCRTATSCNNASAAIVKCAVSSPRCWSDLRTKQWWQLVAWFQQWLCTAARRAPDDRHYRFKKNQLFFTICNNLGLSKLRINRHWTHHINNRTKEAWLVVLFLWNIILLRKIEPVFPTDPRVP